jgi:flagellar biosynthesis/type III secretory pathway protein FliH
MSWGDTLNDIHKERETYNKGYNDGYKKAMEENKKNQSLENKMKLVELFIIHNIDLGNIAFDSSVKDLISLTKNIQNQYIPMLNNLDKYFNDNIIR